MINILFISLQLFTVLWPRESDTLKMLFLGDVMQHESQLQSAYDRSTGKGDPDSYDYSPYFKYLKPWFSKADIVAANMETTFAPPPYSGYPVFASPSSLAKEAHRAGINLFFAANNHSADKGARGLKGSLELFREMGIPFTGIYENSEVAHREHPLIIEKEGFKIAILNYTYGTNGIEVPHPYIVKQLDSTLVRKELERAQHLSPDCIIVSVHWGQEYSLEPSASQKKWENLFYSNGADLVIGSPTRAPKGSCLPRLHRQSQKDHSLFPGQRHIQHECQKHTGGHYAGGKPHKGAFHGEHMVWRACSALYLDQPPHSHRRVLHHFTNEAVPGKPPTIPHKRGKATYKELL